MQIIRKARHEDLDTILQLVGQAGLETEGIAENVDHFLIMEKETDRTTTNEESLIAVVGFELQKQNALLRSFVMNDKSNQFNILEIVQAILDYSNKNGLKKLFLCTKKQPSVKLFQMLGFQLAEETPAELKSFSHYQNIYREKPYIMYYENPQSYPLF
ncbi:MAG TPA: GNAT family N-acetyltransferase [Bacillus bacterium]|nr:GNAT family N-acetyltransferase [Bacillus sp. (in: firmicutes)]